MIEPTLTCIIRIHAVGGYSKSDSFDIRIILIFVPYIPYWKKSRADHVS